MNSLDGLTPLKLEKVLHKNWKILKGLVCIKISWIHISLVANCYEWLDL